jgi:hypothetical protein
VVLLKTFVDADDAGQKVENTGQLAVEMNKLMKTLVNKLKCIAR